MVLVEVRKLLQLYKDEVTSITITGHSLGQSLATLNAVDIVTNGVNCSPADSSQPPCPVTAIVFASPRVGDCHFKAAFASFSDMRALHVKNAGDVVPLYPPLGYVDVAVRLPIYQHEQIAVPTPAGHGADAAQPRVLPARRGGEQGSAGGFKLEVDRDVALVNKSVDALKDKYPVPAEWWVVNQEQSKIS
ncbi:hypothetical protein GUJ93_ZPchr0005g14910 [Zizania palustris]|uniref:Phospholipase A1 n=1 Tax=Zizania palustris TaxID=103762 RepID=A0A8J5T5M8_ZIZPA|nr:hypothetical protein GUJ93_ZPchr0005g14910 [Zizania palustris]